jgi:hypothetical protein
VDQLHLLLEANQKIQNQVKIDISVNLSIDEPVEVRPDPKGVEGKTG